LGTAGGDDEIQPAALPLKRRQELELTARSWRRRRRQQEVGGGGGGGNGKENKTAAMAMANQDGDAKPVKTGMGSRQHGACHTRSLW